MQLSDKEEDEIREICTPVHLKDQMPLWVVILLGLVVLSILIWRVLS